MGKDSILLYTAYREKFKKLTDEQFGKLVRAMLEYEATGKDPVIDDMAVSLSFDVVRYDMDVNTKKYQEKCDHNRENIKKRWEKKKDTTVYDRKRTNTNHTDNDNDNDNDNDIKLNNQQSSTPIAVEFDQLWQMYPKKEGRKEAHLAYERARKKGVKYEDVKAGIVRYNNHISRNRVQRQYIMQGSTFFRGERWADEWRDNQQKPTAFANFAGRDYGDDTMLKLIQM